MRWIVPPEFSRVLNSKPPTVQERFYKALNLMDQDLHYPSLRVSKLSGRKGVWYARASRSDRVTFRLKGDTIELIMNCGHDIL